jgi:hypothetical protein
MLHALSLCVLGVVYGAGMLGLMLVVGVESHV